MSHIHINQINVDLLSNKKLRIVEDLKERNKYFEKVTAGIYFENKFSYAQTFQMFEDYKKAFLSLSGKENETITLSAPATISSINAFYGAMDANKIVNSFGPGFLHAFTDKYIKEFESETIFIYDGFLNDEFINKLYKAGVKNVIVTSITDYMNPMVEFIGKKKGLIPKYDFLDNYVRSGKKFPQGMQFIKLSDFAKEGHKIKESIDFPYADKQIAARFLTGGTTSQIPKCVELYADGFNKMADIYDNTWFDFNPGDINTVFIPPFYATGMIHGVHAGLFSTLTNVYKPKYDRFAFGNDLYDSKARIALVAPSHVATLEESGLKDDSLKQLRYIFIGGEAILPSQMEKFRKTAKRLGIQHILNGYGMTETASMTGVSDKNSLSDDDVTIMPAPFVKFRIVDPDTHEELPDNTRGILEMSSPCVMAGYTDEELNKKIFTKDGWIHTGDVAIRYSDGRYRVFGRDNDYFTNNNQKYAMFDIEEEVLKHPAVLEAEVIKYKLNDENEYPAIVVVVKQEWKNKLEEVLKYISNMKIEGMNYLIGTRFIDKFKTNPITSKRDYLILSLEKNGYYMYDNSINQIFTRDIDDGEVLSYKSDGEIIIFDSEKEKKIVK